MSPICTSRVAAHRARISLALTPMQAGQMDVLHRTPYDIAPPMPEKAPAWRPFEWDSGSVLVPVELLQKLERAAFAAAHPSTWQQVHDLLGKRAAAQLEAA